MRSGEQVAKDMIVVRIGPDMRMAVVGAPRISLRVPHQEAAGPDRSQCINLRLATYGRLEAWELERGGREPKVRVDSFSGISPHYPSRRQLSPAFALLVDALRYRSNNGAAFELSAFTALAEAFVKNYGPSVHAYVRMSDHFHAIGLIFLSASASYWAHAPKPRKVTNLHPRHWHFSSGGLRVFQWLCARGMRHPLRRLSHSESRLRCCPVCQAV